MESLEVTVVVTSVLPSSPLPFITQTGLQMWPNDHTGTGSLLLLSPVPSWQRCHGFGVGLLSRQSLRKRLDCSQGGESQSQASLPLGCPQCVATATGLLPCEGPCCQAPSLLLWHLRDITIPPESLSSHPWGLPFGCFLRHMAAIYRSQGAGCLAQPSTTLWMDRWSSGKQTGLRVRRHLPWGKRGREGKPPVQIGL